MRKRGNEETRKWIFVFKEMVGSWTLFLTVYCVRSKYYYCCYIMMLNIQLTATACKPYATQEGQAQVSPLHVQSKFSMVHKEQVRLNYPWIFPALHDCLVQCIHDFKWGHEQWQYTDVLSAVLFARKLKIHFIAILNLL